MNQVLQLCYAGVRGNEEARFYATRWRIESILSIAATWTAGVSGWHIALATGASEDHRDVVGKRRTHLESLESLRLWVKGPDASKAEAGKLSGPCADVAVFLGVEMRTMLGFLGDLVQVLHIHPTIESERAARKDGQELQPPFGDIISFLSFADAAADTARCGGQDDITTAVKALLTLVMSTSVKSIKNLPPITL